MLYSLLMGPEIIKLIGLKVNFAYIFYQKQDLLDLVAQWHT